MIRKRAGFTVVELSITLAVMAIITAIAVPNILNWIPDFRVRSAADDLFGNLQMARATAIRNNQPCTITFSPGQYSIDLLNKTVLLSKYGSGVQFGGPGGETYPSGGTIVFSTRGLPSVAGYVHFTDSDNTAYYRAGTLISGVIRKQKRVGTTWR